MLFPNLQININKKRGTNGLDDAQVINTPVILDLAVEMSDEKQNFAFNQQPSLNQFHLRQKGQNDKTISLQTPILDINHVPFFNQTSTSISPSDALNNFVAPNEILNTYTTASSSTPTSTTNTYNDLIQNNNHLTNLISNDLNEHHHPLSSKIMSKQQDIQDYHQFTTYSTTNQLNQYTSNTINHQMDLNDNMTTLNSHHHLTNQQVTGQQNNLTYTELKPSNQPQLLIPNSVYDISGCYGKQQKQPPSYPSPSSPTNSISSQTSSSNLDNQDSLYGQFGESSTSHHLNRSNRRYASVQSSLNEKKSRMTKKQKYDAMIDEEKKLTKNNEQLKKDIKDLEDMIVRYKQTIMNQVKNNK